MTKGKTVEGDCGSPDLELESLPVVQAEPVNVRCYPLGYRAAISLTLGYLGAICSTFSIFTCFVEGDNILFGYTCLRFVPASAYSYEDAAFRYGRVASFVGALGGLVFTSLATGVLSCRPSTTTEKTKAWVGLGFLVLSVSCLVGLIARTTSACAPPSDCQIGAGFQFAAAAAFLYFVAGISSWYHMARSLRAKGPDEISHSDF
ncbi:expressed unknown protein [Seminavis robusta]|uniref:Uncharacterized protein n=1 Tax=Seminavis robusta TaxID=568900 RepID=A0A9N8H6S4_9STRA|nr:expressed unknown protein [Seminavis robusta]|eukprot:Sro156_g070790.1 n/a (204) ;mRNA; r:47511-48236